MKTNNKVVTLLLFIFLTIPNLKAQNLVTLSNTIQNNNSIFHQTNLPMPPLSYATNLGGNSAIARFIADKLKYPDLAIENGIEGAILLRFIVNIDGSISNIKVVQGLGYGCDEQAIALLKQMPKLNTALIDSSICPSLHYIKIHFTLY